MIFKPEPVTPTDVLEASLMPTQRKAKKPTLAEARARLARWEANFGGREPEDAAQEWRALMTRADIARLVEAKLGDTQNGVYKMIANLADRLQSLEDSVHNLHTPRHTQCGCWVCRRIGG